MLFNRATTAKVSRWLGFTSPPEMVSTHYLRYVCSRRLVY